MAIYKVQLQRADWVTLTVEAEDEDAALDAAYELAPGEPCGQCSGWGESWYLDVGDWTSEALAIGACDTPWFA
jgi:hypothetical protein